MAIRSSATAVAHSNIALVKYWGKRPIPGNYPAVPSLSLTLDRLFTRTQVTFDADLNQDEFELDGAQVVGPGLQRVARLLDEVRDQARTQSRARVCSVNNFPTAAGLASSASGFAALALAASSAAALQWPLQQVSSLARASSASAARSVFGGWVALGVGARSAERLPACPDWDLALVIAVTEKGPKSVGSTEGMNLCSATSCVYLPWLERSPLLFERARLALSQGDLTALGQAMEESTWLMHATMMTATPALVYLAPVSLEIIRLIRNRRSSEVPAYFTTDAGPHVKVLTALEHAEEVMSWLADIPGVSEVLVCRPGPDAFVESSESEGGIA